MYNFFISVLTSSKPGTMSTAGRSGSAIRQRKTTWVSSSFWYAAVKPIFFSRFITAWASWDQHPETVIWSPKTSRKAAVGASSWSAITWLGWKSGTNSFTFSKTALYSAVCNWYQCLSFMFRLCCPTLITALTVPQVGRDYSVLICVPCAYAYNCAYSYKKTTLCHTWRSIRFLFPIIPVPRFPPPVIWCR